MNEEGSPSSQRCQQHELGNNSNEQTIGQVAQHAKTFSQTSSIPTTFGKYDSFYLSLRKSDYNSKQQGEQKRWLRKHQYRGDEKVQVQDCMASLVLSPEVNEDMLEVCDIEVEGWCLVGDGGTSCDEVPALQSRVSTVNLNPRICNTDAQNPNTKHELTPIHLDDAFMDLTLGSALTYSSQLLSKSRIITPDASSLRDNYFNPSSPFKASSPEPMASSSRYLSPSDLYLESKMHMSDICKNYAANTNNGVCFRSPDRKNKNSTNDPELDLTPLSKAIIGRSGSRNIRNVGGSSPDLTPLSKAILCRKKRSIDFADAENLCRNLGR